MASGIEIKLRGHKGSIGDIAEAVKDGVNYISCVTDGELINFDRGSPNPREIHQIYRVLREGGYKVTKVSLEVEKVNDGDN
ncbi:MAG: hypothetical protein WC494_00130 [Candidatus Pacearchaeota archaeon]